MHNEMHLMVPKVVFKAWSSYLGFLIFIILKVKYNLLKLVSRHYIALRFFKVIFRTFCHCFVFFQRKIEKIQEN